MRKTVHIAELFDVTNKGSISGMKMQVGNRFHFEIKATCRSLFNLFKDSFLCFILGKSILALSPCLQGGRVTPPVKFCL